MIAQSSRPPESVRAAAERPAACAPVVGSSAPMAPASSAAPRATASIRTSPRRSSAQSTRMRWRMRPRVESRVAAGGNGGMEHPFQG
ncbi:hypothetical protein [Streptomyces sirii]|uniref:hypothetical protein n=1 Tax=Streptomyces sirii TaxID=3127701 RepID=UPI003D36DDCF